MLLNAGREPKLADAPSAGGERSAPRTWELSPGRGAGAPEAQGRAPSAGRGGDAPLLFPPSRGPLSALPSPRRLSDSQPGAPRRWRRRTRRRREPGASGRRRRRRREGPGQRGFAARPGAARPYPRGLRAQASHSAHRPLGHAGSRRTARGRRAGPPAQPRMPRTLLTTFTSPPGRT